MADLAPSLQCQPITHPLLRLFTKLGHRNAPKLIRLDYRIICICYSLTFQRLYFAAWQHQKRKRFQTVLLYRVMKRFVLKDTRKEEIGSWHFSKYYTKQLSRYMMNAFLILLFYRLLFSQLRVIKDGQIENYRHSIWRLLRGKASQLFCKGSNVNEHRLTVSLITCLLSWWSKLTLGSAPFPRESIFVDSLKQHVCAQKSNYRFYWSLKTWCCRIDKTYHCAT